MFKTLNLGIILGLLGAAALVHYVPAVDQYRETSMISVQSNGGNSESFHINLPRDRILVGQPNAAEPVPPGLEWPEDPLFDGTQAELFKVRDRNDAVIGIASRFANRSEESGAFIQWVLHFPARGTLFASMEQNPSPEGYRRGSMTAGTRDFTELRGELRERFLTDIQDGDFETDSRIQLVASLVGPRQDEEE